MTALLSATSSLAETELARVRRLTADTIRGLAMGAVQKANSGHPGKCHGHGRCSGRVVDGLSQVTVPRTRCGLIAIDLSSRLGTAPF